MEQFLFLPATRDELLLQLSLGALLRLSDSSKEHTILVRDFVIDDNRDVHIPSVRLVWVIPLETSELAFWLLCDLIEAAGYSKMGGL